METYHKIQTLFKRHQDGSKKGKMIRGEWTTPELKYLKDNEWDFTEKVDGTNVRIHLTRVDDFLCVDYGGRTDNAVLPKPLLAGLEDHFPTNPTWRRDLTIPHNRSRYDLVGSWMLDNDLTDVTLFGEGYGPKIQGGGKYRDDQSFVLFDVKVGDWWLNREAVNDVAEKLDIEVVPTIGQGTLQDAIDIVESGLTFNKAGAVVRWGRGGLKSQWGDFEAEGLVCRPSAPLFDRKGNRIICKVKAVDFK